MKILASALLMAVTLFLQVVLEGLVGSSKALPNEALWNSSQACSKFNLLRSPDTWVSFKHREL